MVWFRWVMGQELGFFPPLRPSAVREIRIGSPDYRELSRGKSGGRHTNKPYHEDVSCGGVSFRFTFFFFPTAGARDVTFPYSSFLILISPMRLRYRWWDHYYAEKNEPP